MISCRLRRSPRASSATSQTRRTARSPRGMGDNRKLEWGKTTSRKVKAKSDRWRNARGNAGMVPVVFRRRKEILEIKMYLIAGTMAKGHKGRGGKGRMTSLKRSIKIGLRPRLNTMLKEHFHQCSGGWRCIYSTPCSVHPCCFCWSLPTTSHAACMLCIVSYGIVHEAAPTTCVYILIGMSVSCMFLWRGGA